MTANKSRSLNYSVSLGHSFSENSMSVNGRVKELVKKNDTGIFQFVLSDMDSIFVFHFIHYKGTF